MKTNDMKSWVLPLENGHGYFRLSLVGSVTDIDLTDIDAIWAMIRRGLDRQAKEPKAPDEGDEA